MFLRKNSGKFYSKFHRFFYSVQLKSIKDILKARLDIGSLFVKALYGSVAEILEYQYGSMSKLLKFTYFQWS